MWHYLYFYVQVNVKDPTEFTGPESYVYTLVRVSFSVDFFLVYINTSLGLLVFVPVHSENILEVFFLKR